MYGVEIITGPTITSPSISEFAAHLGLGDLYDAADAAAVLSAAASIARELTGRSVGATQYRLSCSHDGGSYVMLPFPSSSCAIDSVSVDGAAVSSGSYELVQIGPWYALHWLSRPSGDRLSVTFTSGTQTLSGVLRSLVLILAADLYRSRESQTPGQISAASITAQWLAALDRLVYASPYSYEGVLV